MSSTSTIRVMVVDEHEIARWGVAAFLAEYPDLEMVGEAADGEEAIRLCRELQPDVVLIDLLMEGMDGIDLIRMIRWACPQTHIIALTAVVNRELIQRVLRAGAIGYLLKSLIAEELAQGIRSVAQGGAAFAAEATEALIDVSTRTRESYSLTAREHEVLGLLARGLHNREISESLAISETTVKTHVSSILAKLGVASRSEAAALATRNNLVP